MLNRLLVLVMPAVLATWCTAASGGTEPSARLVEFGDLQERLVDPQLRLLDARPRTDYDKEHIPGAVWVDAKGVEALAAKPGMLTEAAAWERWITPLGITPETEVLVYDASRQLDAARLWWLLTYLDVEKVGLIDGGFPLWVKQGRPTTTEVPAINPRPFKVAFRKERYATKPDVLDALKEAGTARVIDARSDAEHVGTDKRAKRAGHVPTSCSLEWNKLVDQDGRFLDEAALRAKLAEIGVKPGEPIIIHCQGGGRASVDAFVLERLGFPTRNYYLGWSDWGNAQDTPVVTGSERDTKP
jgi:thiosulfate/3-mercaptopyruvate sulfurtransferase